MAGVWLWSELQHRARVDVWTLGRRRVCVLNNAWREITTFCIRHQLFPGKAGSLLICLYRRESTLTRFEMRLYGNP